MTPLSQPARPGPWIRTASGRRWQLTAPHPDDVHVEDIATGLGNLCRFTGQLPRGVFYSVAQHCVLLAQELARREGAPETVLWGLLHDAAEAYLGDVSRPLRVALAGPDGKSSSYAVLEHLTEGVILAALDLAPTRATRLLVQEMDDALLLLEAQAFGVDIAEAWPGPVPVTQWVLAEPIEPWTPGEARSMFLALYDDQRGTLGASPPRLEGTKGAGEELGLVLQVLTPGVNGLKPENFNAEIAETQRRGGG